MGQGGVVAFAAVAFALVGLVGWLSWRAERERSAALAAWASSVGASYASQDPSYVERWQGDPFGEGHRRQATNVVTGVRDGRPFCAFDYCYTTYSTNSEGERTSQDHRWVVCGLALPARLGWVEVTPEGLGAKVLKAFGGQDVELESAAFNDRYRVRAHDAKLASDVLTPRTMEALLAGPTVAWRLEEGWALSWEQDARLSPAEAEARLRVLAAVVDRVPRFVWRAHGYDPV